MSETGKERGRRRLGEVVVVLFFFAIAGIVFQQTSTSFVEQGAASGDAMFNAAMFPEFIAWGLIILGIVQLVAIFRPNGTVAATETGTAASEPIDPQERRDSRHKALLCLAFFVFYIATIKLLGYHLMTPLFMFACYYILGTRNILLAAALAIGTSLFMSFIFEYWMSVILPVGIFGIGF
ncbi:MAG: tripartite tricarboxylate transporter TctB family protein [Pseudomonadota bacterium]